MPNNSSPACNGSPPTAWLSQSISGPNTRKGRSGSLRAVRVVENVPLPPGRSVAYQVRKPKIMWAKISGKHVLEGPQEFPATSSRHRRDGRGNPPGDEVYRSSVIRYAKDPQRLYNLSRSARRGCRAANPKRRISSRPNRFPGFENAFWAQRPIAPTARICPTTPTKRPVRRNVPRRRCRQRGFCKKSSLPQRT